MGTRGKKEKFPLPLPPKKEKNWTVHECMSSLPICCMKFLFPNLFVTVFHLGRGKILGTQ